MTASRRATATRARFMPRRWATFRPQRFKAKLLRVRVNSAIDAAGTTFRFFGIVEFNDGTSAEAFDAGQIDAAGQIALILTFAGRLGEPGAAPAQPLPGR